MTDLAHAAVVGKEVRLGKLAPKLDDRTLKLARYLAPAAQLPAPPSKVLRSNFVPVNQWGMLGNDSLGDCTIAAAGHATQLTSAVVSKGVNMRQITTDQIVSDYWATGNPPTPGTDDNGRVELDVLNYWRSNGIAGSKIFGYAALDLKNYRMQVRQTIDLFGFVYLGVALPVSAQNQKSWKKSHGNDPETEPGSWGGHAVIAVDYNRSGVTVVTWGTLVKMTWGFFNKYVEEAYAAILQDWLDANNHSVAGFDLQQLQSDLSQL